jgi:hypothetical protein
VFHGERRHLTRWRPIKVLMAHRLLGERCVGSRWAEGDPTMSTRPADWSALGLSADPTPGDADSLQQVLSLLNDISQATGTIESTLQAVLGTAGSGNFEGLTAQALQGQISSRFIHFMSAASSSFSTAYSAANTFSASLSTYQNIADTALTKAQAVTPPPPPPPPVDPLIGPLPTPTPTITDPQVLAWQSQANQAGTDLLAAATAAANAIGAVSNGVEPISGWQEFWEALGWIALLLMIPAIIFGGFFAILAFAVNMVLFIHAAVQFGEGQISFGQLLLSFLGIIAPTTEGLDLATLIPSLLRGAGDLLTDSVNFLKFGLSEFMNLTRAFSFTGFFSVDTLLAIGRFAYTGLVWTFNGIKALPTLAADGSLAVGKSLGNLLVGAGRSIIDDFQTGAWVRLVLPLKGSEISTVGFAGAFRLGILERGFGASADPLLNFRMLAATGLHGADAGTRMFSLSSDDFFKANPLQSKLDTPGSLSVAKLDPNGLVAPHDINTSMPLNLGADSLGLRPGDMGFSTVGVGRTGFLDLGGLRFNDTAMNPASSFTPMHLTLDQFGTTAVANRAFGHSDSVFDLRNPVEISGVHLGTSQVVHMDDFSMVIKTSDLGTSALPPVHLASGTDSTVTAASHVDTGVNADVNGKVGGLVANGKIETDFGRMPEFNQSELALGNPAAAHLPGLKSLGDSTLDVGEGALIRPFTGSVISTDSSIRSVSTLDFEMATALHTSFSEKAFNLVDTTDRGSTPKLDLDQAPTLSAVDHQPAPHPVAATDSVSASALDVHSVVEAESPDRAGVPGVLGLPGERVAVRWNEHQIAQHEYAEALDKFDRHHPQPDANGAESSKMGAERNDPIGSGPVPAPKAAAAADLKQAADRIQTTADALHAIDEDPAHIHALAALDLLESIKERPRLVGGVLRTDLVTRTGEDGLPIAFSRALGTDGMRLEIDAPAGAVERGTLIGGDNRQLLQGDLVELGQGSFRLNGPRPGAFHEFDSRGELVRQGLPLTAVDGTDLGRLQINPLTHQAVLHDLGGNTTNFAHELRINGDHVLVPGDGTWLRYDSDGRLIRQNLIVNRPGSAAEHVEIDLATDHAYVGPPTAQRDVWRYTPNPQGGFRMEHPDNVTRREFAADGTITRQNLAAMDHDGVTALGTLEINHTAGTARITQGNAVTNFRYAAQATGHRLIDPANALMWRDLDANGRLVGRQLPAANHDAIALGDLHINYANGTATITHPVNGIAQFNHVAQGAVERLVDQANPAVWRDFDAAGNVIGRNLVAQDHTGAALGTLHIDHNADTATITDPHNVVTQFDHAAQPGAYRIIDQGNGTWRDFDPAGHVVAEDLAPVRPGGPAFGHLQVDYRGNPAITAVTDHDGTRGAWTYNVDPVGGFRLARDNNELLRFDHNWQLLEEHVAVHDPAGTAHGVSIRADHTAHPPTFAVHDATGARDGRFTVELRNDGPGNHWKITDRLDGPHQGDWRTYDMQGRPLGEDIRVLNRFGRPRPVRISVDYTARTWHYTDGAGLPRRGYGSAGSIARRDNGDLELTGPDKSPVYTRETLLSGNSVETFKFLDGSSRYWHEWNPAGGSVGFGRRHFSLEPGDTNYYDLGWYGQTLRDYRKTLDGGVVRAEKMPDGSFQWVRLDRNGLPNARGVRQGDFFGLRGYRDVVTLGNGQTRMIQQKWTAFNWLSSAGHYREHGVELDQATGRWVPKNSYKEVSPQAKDTGSAETLQNGNTLTWTRFVEQRTPVWTWKTPENIDGPVSRTLARTFVGRKYGAVDFPHDGFIRGDARYQAFKWEEKTPVGAVHAQGVRALTPDGSASDFTRGGTFVRGMIKLDNGHTVEIGRDPAVAGKWGTVLTGPVPPGGRTLPWRQLDSAKNTVASGTRHFDGQNWVDVDTAGQVVRHIEGADGNVVHYFGTNRPTYDNTLVGNARIVRTGNEVSITRDTMGNIVGRGDHWGQIVGPNHFGPRLPPARVTGSGDPRTGDWAWDRRGNNAANGVRINSRNVKWTGSWDDSYADFRTVANGPTTQVRDFRSLEKGISIRAEDDGTGVWHAEKFDANGDPVAGSAAIREWRQPDGTWGGARPDGMAAVPWRDLDGNGNVLRDLHDNRVREYTHPGHSSEWKEYDFGQVIRDRAQTSTPGIFRERELLQKQWRETGVRGELVRYRALSGRVFQRDNSLGRWGLVVPDKQVGKETEDKGWLTAGRAANQRFRESNRREFSTGAGAAGKYVSEGKRITQKVLADVVQDYVIDVVANIIITGAVDDWNFDGDDWGKIFAGGAIKAGFKGAYSFSHETFLKGPKEGLANLDSGKDWNRNPYNHDKNIDNEWGGNENPRRWRSTLYDYSTSTIGLGMISNFVSNTVTAAAFGVGADHVKLSGADAAKAGAQAMAGGLIGGLSVGAGRTFFHSLSSGRLFHKGGIGELSLLFGEKLLEKWLINDVLNPAEGLKPKPPKTDGSSSSS